MDDVIDGVKRGGGGTSLQPYPLPEEILLPRGLDGTTTRGRDEGRDGGPGGGGEARPLHLPPARDECEHAKKTEGGRRRRLFTFSREHRGTTGQAVPKTTYHPPASAF